MVSIQLTHPPPIVSNGQLFGHLDPSANGQAVIHLTGLLEVFISELSILATVSDNSVRYQAINVVKR